MSRTEYNKLKAKIEREVLLKLAALDTLFYGKNGGHAHEWETAYSSCEKAVCGRDQHLRHAHCLRRGCLAIKFVNGHVTGQILVS